MKKEETFEKGILMLSKEELATRFEYDQIVYLIEITRVLSGDKIKIQRSISSTRYLIRDIYISVFTGAIDCRLLSVDSKCVYDTITVSGTLVWATENEALNMIESLNAYCSEIPADSCGGDPKCF